MKLPSNTCWGGVVIMFDSLLEGKSADMDSPIKRMVEIFWERVVSSLKPIAVAIARIKGDDA